MKKNFFLLGILLAFIAEIVALIVFAVQIPDSSLDTVAVNEVVQTVTKDFEKIEEHTPVSNLHYVVVDKTGKVMYQTTAGLSENENMAIKHRDTILDITIDEQVVGKVFIYNDSFQQIQSHKIKVIIVLTVAIFLQAIFCLSYALYLYVKIIKPFHKMKGFAERVAGGNLDIPLEMDRGNLFGAFTESFDIMRSELKKARLAEAEANASKKELVAKLSHDIKTPIASIKAISECRMAVIENDKDKANYLQIINKADQINTLVTNLFSATLEELEQLTVNPTFMDSRRIKHLLENADYLHRAELSDIPACQLCKDELRLQQVLDNIFANSYKYANTDIIVTIQKLEPYFQISIEDFGGGVPATELPVLKEKFKRGSNASNIEGAGLGLYISDYFMNQMNGKLQIENGIKGLKVTLLLLMSGSKNE